MIGNTQQPAFTPQGVVQITPESNSIPLGDDVDILVRTAKAYPRDLKRVLENVEFVSTKSQNTASNCLYSVKRKGANGDKIIEGMSVRFAEIVLNSWTNTRLIPYDKGFDGKFVTVGYIAWDVENNNAIGVEIKRRATYSDGRPYNDDMLLLTTNAAFSIAYRNAVQKLIPYALFDDIIEKVRAVALGQGETPQQQWVKIRRYFQSVGVSERQLLDYVDIESTDGLTQDMIIALKGLANAIHEGSASVENTFVAERQLAEGELQSRGNLGMVESAMAKSKGGQ